MAAPTFVNAGALASPGFVSSISPSLPASLVNGNLLVAVMNCSSTNRDASFPAGWSRIGIVQSAGDYSLVFGAHIVDGTEGSTVTLTASGSGTLKARVYQFTGNDPASVAAALHDSAVTVNANSATFTNPGITSTQADSLAVCLWGGNNGAPTGTPTGYGLLSNDTFIAGFAQTLAGAGDTSDPISQALSATMRWGSYSFEILSPAASSSASDVVPGAHTFDASDSWTVREYDSLTIELWGAGASGDSWTGNGVVEHGSDGGDTTLAGLGLTAGGGKASTGALWQNAPAGAGGTATGGEVNTPGGAGDPGATERDDTTAPASNDGGGSSPFGGAGGARHGAGTSGAQAGNAGSAPGGGGGAARATGFGIAFGGWFTRHGAGGGAGAYTKLRFIRGESDAPEPGDVLTFTVGTGGAAATGDAVNSGAGANGRVRFTVGGFDDLSPSEGGSEVSEPSDQGDAIVSIVGPNPPAISDVLTALFDDTDPDGAATGLALQWRADGADISGATGSAYTVAPGDLGKVLTLAASYTDGQGFLEHIESLPTAEVVAGARPLDYLDDTALDEIWAAYSVRQLRTAYTGPLLQLRHSTTEDLEDFFPDANGDLDMAAIAAWRATQGAEFGPTVYAKWYDQSGHGRHVSGLLRTVSNAPMFANTSPFLLPNGRPSVSFNGNQEFRLEGATGPGHVLAFLAVIMRDNHIPGRVFGFDHGGNEGTLNAEFAFADSTAQDWEENAAVFVGHGRDAGRSPRAIKNGAYTEDDTDCVVWDGELSAVRNGLRRNGIPIPLSVNVHTGFTAIGNDGVFTIGPDVAATGHDARIPEIVVFRADVRESIPDYRESAALYFIGEPEADPSELSDVPTDPDPASDTIDLTEPPSEPPSSVASEPPSSGASEPPSEPPSSGATESPSSGASEEPSETATELPPEEPLAPVQIAITMT